MKERSRKILIGMALPLVCACANGNSSSSGSRSSSGTGSSQSSSSSLPSVSEVKGRALVDEGRPFIKWNGRYEFKLGDVGIPSMVYNYFTATGLTVDFVGTELEIEFYHSGTNIYYDVAIDDETLPNPLGRRFHLSSSQQIETIKVAEGLSNGRHTLTVLKMDEGSDALTGVISVKTDGTLIERDKAQDDSKTKFMFVCASGGTGFGALGYSEVSEYEVTRTRANSSSLHAFNYMTARRFGGDVQFVNSSGWGVSYPKSKAISKIIWKDGVTPTNDVESSLETGDWDYRKYKPNVIIFNIGGNDTGQSGFDVPTYQKACVDMVLDIHEKYPVAKMIWTHTVNKAGTYALSAFETAGIMGDGYMKEGIIPKVGQGETGKGTYGASGHNSFKTHLDAEKALTKILTDWGMTPTVEPLEFEQFESILDRR